MAQSIEQESINFDKLFGKKARECLTRARDEADRLNHKYIGTEHLLLGILGLKNDPASGVLNILGIELQKARAVVEFTVGKGPSIGPELGLTPNATEVIKLSAEDCKKEGALELTPKHLIRAILILGRGRAVDIIEVFAAGNLDRIRKIAGLLESN